MLAPAKLPADMERWNASQGAPSGRRRLYTLARAVRRDAQGISRRFPRFGGPFSHQPNNSTRVFEYPWAFGAVPLRRGMTVVEVGGGLSGFQFALATAGAEVINVDPGLEARGVGWPVDARSIARLNRAYRTNVRLIPSTLEAAEIPSDSIDAVYSISTIEHIPLEARTDTMRDVARILRRGGHAVLTVDLFAELSPFTTRTENRWGSNADIRRLIDDSGLDLMTGNRAELNGFAEFDPDRILSRLSDYFVGAYPALAQCFVLVKR